MRRYRIVRERSRRHAQRRDTSQQRRTHEASGRLARDPPEQRGQHPLARLARGPDVCSLAYPAIIRLVALATVRRTPGISCEAPSLAPASSASSPCSTASLFHRQSHLRRNFRGTDGSALLSQSQRWRQGVAEERRHTASPEQRARAPDGASLKSEAVSSPAGTPVRRPEDVTELLTGPRCCSADQAKADEAGPAKQRELVRPRNVVLHPFRGPSGESVEHWG